MQIAAFRSRHANEAFEMTMLLRTALFGCALAATLLLPNRASTGDLRLRQNAHYAVLGRGCGVTICVAVAVYDGIVFAADSATSLSGFNAAGEPVIVNVYDHGNKVFNLVRGMPLVAMTSGMGNFGRAPIAALSKDLRRLLSTPGTEYAVDLTNYTLEEIARKARKFFYEEKFLALDPPPHPSSVLEYWIGGYASSSELHEVWKITIQGANCPEPQLLRAPGEQILAWGGQPDAVHRLVLGFSNKLEDALRGAGLDPGTVAQLMPVIQQSTEVPIVAAPMPIGDAIELADFLVDTTKRFVRFLPGADTVGGDTDIATVTRHERFKWIKRKHYYPASLNPRDIDHV